MAMLNVDMTHVDPTPRFDPIPAGDYLVTITESETKPTKDGSGQYLSLKLEVQHGEFAGRVLFDRLNLWSSNHKAKEIANRQLSQICHAVGVLQVQDSQQLHYKPLVAMVKLRPADGQYDASNDVKGYKQAALGGGMAPAPQPFQAPRAQPAPQSASQSAQAYAAASQGSPAYTPPPAPPAPAFQPGQAVPWVSRAA